MRQVYTNAGLNPSDCGFVEAHGTGTRVGDPIEATAIYNVLGTNRSPRDPLYIGSVSLHSRVLSSTVAATMTNSTTRTR